MKNHLKKSSLVAFAVATLLAGVSAQANAASYFLIVPMATRTTATPPVEPTPEITVALNAASLPGGRVADVYAGFNFGSTINITGDAALDPQQVQWSGSAIPAGLALSSQGQLTGTPATAGEFNLQVQADYKTKTATRTYALSIAEQAWIVSMYGARTWRDGTYAASCLDYRTPSSPKIYEGAVGDGIYRIAPAGAPMDVYCDMTTDGGGYTLLMKQAKGDGATLEGTTSHWTAGTPLNDSGVITLADGNFVSKAFAALPVTQFRLVASNEATAKYHTRASATALVAMSNANRTDFVDGNNTPGTVSSVGWSINETNYPSGPPIISARFGFNFMETYPSMPSSCGARWGWAANENDNVPGAEGSHDACGGLGAYGVQYGSIYMLSSVHTWQKATYYLWAR